MKEVEGLRDEYRKAATALRTALDHDTEIDFIAGGNNSRLDLAVLGLAIQVCDERAQALDSQ
jgi:hypothetical protein